MVLRIIRWLRGYVAFSVRGRFPERFINLLNRGGITYWELLPDSKGYGGKMLLSDYKSIRPTARRAGVRLKCESRFGMPFFVKKYKRRKGILIGALLAFLMMLGLSRFVWVVNITDAESLSISDFKKVVSDCGLRVGALKSEIDTLAVERDILLKEPQLSWVSVNLLNNVATVQVKKKARKPKSRVSDYFCNIKAACDGVITETVVYNGTCEIQKGTAVTKNQLLVSAVVEGTEERLSYVHSNADIFADVRDIKEFNIPIKKNIIIPQKNYTEKSTDSFLWFCFPGRLSSSVSQLNVKNFYTYCLQANGVNLPLGETVERSLYFDREKQSISPERAQKILENKLALYECFCEGESKIKRRSVKILQKKNEYSLRVNYLLNKNIAEKQRIEVK